MVGRPENWGRKPTTGARAFPDAISWSTLVGGVHSTATASDSVPCNTLSVASRHRPSHGWHLSRHAGISPSVFPGQDIETAALKNYVGYVTVLSCASFPTAAICESSPRSSCPRFQKGVHEHERFPATATTRQQRRPVRRRTQELSRRRGRSRRRASDHAVGAYATLQRPARKNQRDHDAGQRGGRKSESLARTDRRRPRQAAA